MRNITKTKSKGKARKDIPSIDLKSKRPSFQVLQMTREALRFCEMRNKRNAIYVYQGHEVLQTSLHKASLVKIAKGKIVDWQTLEQLGVTKRKPTKIEETITELCLIHGQVERHG